MSQPILVGFDYETHLFGPENLAPKPVCLSVAINADPQAETVEELDLDEDGLELGTAGDGDLEPTMDELLQGVDQSESIKLVGANVAFDLAVAAADDDRKLRSGGRFPLIFKLLTDQKISDVQIREKLLLLSTQGSLAYRDLPDGTTRKITGAYYGLGPLTERYLGIVVEKAQGDAEGQDAWRLNYDALEDLPMVEWPEEAVDYAIKDSIYPTLIWRLQEAEAKRVGQDIGIDPFQTEAFRVAVRFSLFLMSAEGVHVDPVEHSRIMGELKDALRPEKLTLLVQTGILRPGEAPQPYANGAKQHDPSCKGAARKDCDCPVKMTKGKAESINKKALTEFVLALREELGEDKVNLKQTDKGNWKIDKEFLEDHYRLSKVLEQYRNRQAVQKLVTTDMPRMEWPKGSGKPAKILHASFDELKETGRTSSYASKAYPSWNCQNPHPRVRAAIVPEDGYVLYSVDYDGMELVTLAQKCYSLFGFSVLRDVINKGWDAHAYLGSHLAYYLDEDFREAVQEECGASPDGDQLYLAFDKCKKSKHEEVRAFFKSYRKLAKPTGLGYPGGLGPETFTQFAHATYGIECDVELAAELREVWHKCFPEMRRYLDWISSSCEDPINPDKYAYVTPLGMYRAGCGYCAAANGAALQSPGAEGALLALCAIQEATFADDASVLYDDEHGPRHRALIFLHDEILGKARIDCAHEVAHEVARIMVDCMKLITPDVTPGASPVLMTRWSKKAEPVFDASGRLIPWSPKEDA